MKVFKILKAVCLIVAVIGAIQIFCVISTCDYEDYCKENGIECETETNPLTALWGVGLVCLGFGTTYVIETLKEKNRSDKQTRNGSKRKI